MYIVFVSVTVKIVLISRSVCESMFCCHVEMFSSLSNFLNCAVVISSIVFADVDIFIMLLIILLYL